MNEPTLKHVDHWLTLRGYAGDNVEQRTPPWYSRRRVSVGGSQLGKLAGHGKYGGPWDVAVDISGKRSRFWSIACAWGEMAEPISVQILERLGGEVRECGSLWGEVPGHSNSVDGLGLLRPGSLARYLDGALLGCGAYDAGAKHRVGGAAEIMVLEFKSYFSRRISPKIDMEHVCQIQGGLDTVHAARRGLLMNTVTRRCCLEDWGYTPKFNREPLAMYGRGPPKPIDYPAASVMTGDGPSATPPPQALAMIVFHRVPPAALPELDDDAVSPLFGDPFGFVPDDEELTPKDRQAAGRILLMKLANHRRGELIEVGSEPRPVVEEVLWQFTSNLLEARYATHVAHSDESNCTAGDLSRKKDARKFLAKTLDDLGANEDTAVAVMPLKVFTIQMHLVDRPWPEQFNGASFTRSLKRAIDIAIWCGARLRQGDDPDEVRAWHDRARTDAALPVPQLAEEFLARTVPPSGMH